MRSALKRSGTHAGCRWSLVYSEPLERRCLLSAAVETTLLSTGTSAAILSSVFPRQMEFLDRGVIAMNRGSGNVYISWRMLGTDPTDIAFNLYRAAGGGAAVKRNGAPLTVTTDFQDTGVNTAVSNAYFVRPVIGGVEQAPSDTYTLAAGTPVQQFLNVPLQVPPGGTTPSGEAYTYSANDTSVGDVDGDGAYELIVKWDPSNSKDNSQSGYTGNVYIDAYELNGTRLWRIDLGRNIRAGAHYTQFQVYDLDGDGRAEMACKTAPGTVDGQGNFVLLAGDDPNADYRTSVGYILSGPEYLTVFNGQTGAAMATTKYIVPRHPTTENPTSSQLNTIWGDGYGNRVDRFLAGVAYLDGQRPSLIMARGYYTRATLAAWDWRDGQLTMRWLFDSDDGTPGNTAYRGQGNHSLSIADVDGDGFDEIVYGAAVIDHNGKGLYSTGYGHGDALHVSDMDPDRPGLEVWDIHEPSLVPGSDLRDAATGAAIFTSAIVPAGTEGPGRGVAADIYAGTLGYEMWGGGGLFDRYGNVVGRTPSSSNFLVWWDADPLRELLDGTVINEYGLSGDARLLTAYQLAPINSINGTKATPCLSGDILGDWREEVIWRANDNASLYIFTTVTPATSRMYTLMHDSQYREAIAWQNTAYNQPPHPSFYLGAADSSGTFPVIPAANIYLAGTTMQLSSSYQAEDAARAGTGLTVDTNHTGYHGSGFVNFPTTGGSVQWNNVDGGLGGLASLTLRYALGNTARTGTLTINGVEQSITFASTGNATTGWTNWTLLSLAPMLNPGATNTILLQSTGQDLANVDELRVTVMEPDTTPPMPIESNFVFTQSPNKLTFKFSENVAPSLNLGKLQLTRDGTTPVTPVAYSYLAGTNTATYTLPSGLPNGNYHAMIAMEGVTDLSSNALSSNFVIDFFVLAGDINRDRGVNIFDLQILASSFLQSGKNYMQGDLNNNGVVDQVDLGIISSNWSQTLALPAPTAMAAGATTPPAEPQVVTSPTAAPRAIAQAPVQRPVRRSARNIELFDELSQSQPARR